MTNWCKSIHLGVQRRGGWIVLVALLFAGILPLPVLADDVSILGATFRGGAQERWNVSVTLRHADTGWEHYADAWRVIAPDGEVFGTRTLLHPHETEQPFTRSLSGVAIPKTVTVVYIEAHDKVHGWAKQRLQVDLSTARNGIVDAKP